MILGFPQIFEGIRAQIQQKRRKNLFGGMWGSSAHISGESTIVQKNNNWDHHLNREQYNIEKISKIQYGNSLNGLDWVREQLQRQSFQIVKVDENNTLYGQGYLSTIRQFLNTQITFLQPSLAQEQLLKLRRQGRVYIDNGFPSDNFSIWGDNKYYSQWPSISWKKISQVMSRPRIFVDIIQPSDIKQGLLGNCYFLAGLAALAERPDRIFNLFLLRQTNFICYYLVKILYKGKWLTIDMDQYIPCVDGKPAFSKSNKNQLWVILLQKAWAKLYSSYKRIQDGYIQQPLHDLTGAPVKHILTANLANYSNKQSQWNYLVMASQKQYAMVATSKNVPNIHFSQSGMVQGYAYTFLNAYVLHFVGGSQRVVKLRNPWGKKQNKGKWNDSDPNWAKVSPFQQERVGFDRNSQNGIFFMTYESFINEFKCLTIAQINDNASYIYKSIKDRQIKGAFFKVEIFQCGYYSLQIDKPPQRTHESNFQNTYRYPLAFLQVIKVTENYCQRYEGCESDKRTLFKGYTLEPGVYIVYAKIDFDIRYQKQFDLTLAVYSEYPCNISIASKQYIQIIANNYNTRNWYLAQNAKKVYKSNSLSNSTRKSYQNSSENEENIFWSKNNWRNSQTYQQGWNQNKTFWRNGSQSW